MRRRLWSLRMLAAVAAGGMLLAGCGGGASKPAASSAAPASGGGGSAASASSSAKGTPVKIAYLDDFTGALGVYGKADQAAVQLAVDQVNAKGGLLGHPIDLLVRDDQTSESQAVAQARDVIYSDHVNFILHGLNSGECDGVGQLAAQNHIVMLSFCGIDNFTTTQATPWTFRAVNFDTRVQAGAAAKYISQNYPNVKRWYLMATSTFGPTTLSEFKAAMAKDMPGATFIGTSLPAVTTTDYTPYITAMLSSHAQGVFYALANGIPFWKQAASYNLPSHFQLMISPLWGAQAELGYYTKAEAPVGAVIDGIPWYGIKNAANSAFVPAYEKAFGSPPIPPVYLAYTSMEFLLQAVQKAGTLNEAAVAKTLASLKLDTPMGTIAMDPWDHQGAGSFWFGKVAWDSQANQARMTDISTMPAQQFLPSQAEFAALKKSGS
jgi:branched-chain amino acid transport system substrate-binding protein